MKLNNKVAVITGGSSGIGLSIAKRFHKEGAKVVIFGRKQEALDAAVAEVGAEVLAVQGDVSKLADLERLYAETVAKHGKVDVLVANAGVAQFAPLEGSDEAHFDQLSDINFKGAFFTVQKAQPHLNDGASVVLTSSAVNQMGMPNTSVYSATKAAVRSLARTLSAELVGRGIRVNVLSPGPIETPIFGKLGLPQEALDGFAADMTEQVPLKRFGQPEEMASAALFLASEDSSYVVGIDLVADGGISQL
ncbi:MAG: NAD(P)-dependent dehydrogenase (short-subunit alcohol dehydrogenase family) [Planctomycetota bacterium]|jgi:NAD(P)-dependent dehydrogenase (short-subunit alcohol dehydrogenase family)